MSGGAEVRASGWGWRHAGRRAWAVSELDLVIEPGERVLLLGASGAGKSTLVSALAGVLGGADEGEAAGSLTVGGRLPESARGTVGLLLQDPDSQVMLARVGDDVAFGCENLGVARDEIWRRVSASLDAVGLHLPLSHPTSELSGGQKQRLALAGVLAMQPSLLLLDEPTANLDPDGVVEVRDAVARVLTHSAATFVVIEHRVEIWRHLVTRVVVLASGGGVLADGPTERVLSSRGAELAASGVWVPEFPPALPARRPARATHPRSTTTPASAATAPTTPAAATTAPATPVDAPVPAAISPAAAGGGRGVLLEARGLGVQRVKGHPVADGLSLDVEAGVATAITGPNGAGKSTFALTLAGLLAPSGGTLTAAPRLAGDRGSEPIRWRSRDLLTRIGTVFQDPEHQFLAATVQGELAVGPRALKLPQAEIDARVDELLARLRLTALAAANPFTLSGGEKRRLSVATVLATRPALLVLDEPTFGQDSRTWSELVALLAELLDDGTALVAVTHDPAFVSALADREFRMPAPPSTTTTPIPATRTPATPATPGGVDRGGRR